MKGTRKNWTQRVVRLITAGLTALVVFVAVGGVVVLQLWNWLLPPLFGWPHIDFWQALGLLALSRILVGGFGGPSRRSRRWSGADDSWERLTPEEREALRLNSPSHVPSGAER